MPAPVVAIPSGVCAHLAAKHTLHPPAHDVPCARAPIAAAADTMYWDAEHELVMIMFVPGWAIMWSIM